MSFGDIRLPKLQINGVLNADSEVFFLYKQRGKGPAGEGPQHIL